MHPASTSIFPKFFEGNHFFIDEKVGLLKFSNQYKVYDAQGAQIGAVVQRVPGWQKVLRVIGNFKAIMPFTLEIQNADGTVESTISRGWTFWMSKIAITDGSGAALGTIRQKWAFLKPTFNIFNSEGVQVASITGDWKAWNFSINGPTGQPIGSITKKWAGIAREFFTSADKYQVEIAEEVAEDAHKIAIVSAAITIDMVLKESK